MPADPITITCPSCSRAIKVPLLNADITPETYAQVHRYAQRADGGRSMNESEEALLTDLERVTAERDEARAVFRDAVHMLAHIARAAGFDPEDPTVEPPAIVARVERLRAERDALQARLDAFAGPVEGMDVEEVLADADALSEAIEGGDHYERDALRERIVDAAPALAREVVALRAALGAAEGERDRLHDRIEGALSAALGDPVMSIHDGDGPTAPDLESLIKLAGQIRRERDELRLTLAADKATG